MFVENFAGVPERSKGVDLRSTAAASWVRIPPPAQFICSLSSVVERGAYDAVVEGSTPSVSTIL